jgi:hypothetical protein
MCLKIFKPVNSSAANYSAPWEIGKSARDDCALKRELGNKPEFGMQPFIPYPLRNGPATSHYLLYSVTDQRQSLFRHRWPAEQTAQAIVHLLVTKSLDLFINQRPGSARIAGWIGQIHGLFVQTMGFVILDVLFRQQMAQICLPVPATNTSVVTRN